MRRTCFVLLLAASGGCAMMTGVEPSAKELDKNAADTDTHIRETKTLSTLAALETKIGAYIKAENKIPKDLEDLVPKYLAEIPTVELGVERHKDSSKVKVYPSEVMRDGQIDGTQLRDTGKWGYTFNDRQVIIFVDCTHNSSRGVPWYQERGVY